MSVIALALGPPGASGKFFKSGRQLNAAWEAAELGDVMPYFTALQLVPIEVTDADRKWALETANAYASAKPF